MIESNFVSSNPQTSQGALSPLPDRSCENSSFAVGGGHRIPGERSCETHIVRTGDVQTPEFEVINERNRLSFSLVLHFYFYYSTTNFVLVVPYRIHYLVNKNGKKETKFAFFFLTEVGWSHGQSSNMPIETSEHSVNNIEATNMPT